MFNRTIKCRLSNLKLMTARLEKFTFEQEEKNGVMNVKKKNQS